MVEEVVPLIKKYFVDFLCQVFETLGKECQSGSVYNDHDHSHHFIYIYAFTKFCSNLYVASIMLCLLCVNVKKLILTGALARTIN
jgi:hypothetical protein